MKVASEITPTALACFLTRGEAGKLSNIVMLDNHLHFLGLQGLKQQASQTRSFLGSCYHLIILFVCAMCATLSAPDLLRLEHPFGDTRLCFQLQRSFRFSEPGISSF